MKRLLLVSAITIFLFGCKNSSDNNVPEEPLSRIAFGSCCHQNLGDKKIFDRILELNPQLYIAGGDNMYGDFFALAPGTKEYMEGAYRGLDASQSWKKLRASVPIIATWDDHDTGENDATTANPVKDIAKDLFFKYWNIPENDPRRSRPDGGIYGSYYYNDDEHRVQVLMLDLRYNHSPYKSSGPAAALSGYDTMLSPNATILGATQWTWLEEELRKPAKVRIIMSSLQFNSLYDGSENWAVLPLEKQKMYDLIKSTGANGVFFLSGDVHYSELTKTQPAGMYPIYDVTSSGITHHEDKVSPRNNSIRVGKGWQYVNFGFIDIDWKASPVSIKLQVFGNTNGSGPNGTLTRDDAKISHTVTLDELKF
ncbi:MAG TPA: alkaline phosphatase D family protein [Chitinophagales bacterium]|nr:alkaline phosphatase D family protein [Chitinophagales bacterium]HNG71679.1 alkaline phosphatase D family protein [Chitinophagales bacterium]